MQDVKVPDCLETKPNGPILTHPDIWQVNLFLKTVYKCIYLFVCLFVCLFGFYLFIICVFIFIYLFIYSFYLFIS